MYIVIDFDVVLVDVFDVYLCLYFLLFCLVIFCIINFDGIFGVFLNNVWMMIGLICMVDFEKVCMEVCIVYVFFIVFLIDKFLCMVDFVVFIGVCIGDVD